jgi:hypothetical protein
VDDLPIRPQVSTGDFPTPIYHAIDEAPGYFVGTDGSVWSGRDARGRPTQRWSRLALYRRPYGARYTVVCLRPVACGQVVQRYVHRLVLDAFVGPAPAGAVAAHADGDTADNRLVNLRWDTVTGNLADKARHGTHGSRLSAPAVVAILRLLAEGVSAHVLARHFRLSCTTIRHIRTGRTWKHIPRPVVLRQEQQT